MERFLNNNKSGRDIGQLLLDSHLTMATAESCTGGTIASMVTAVAGSSGYFRGGIVSYAAQVKEEVLGVTLRQGIVSEDTALQMARGAARVCKADCAVATTGVAGPGSSDGCAQGTVCIAACLGDDETAHTFMFNGEREDVILQAADAALCMLADLIRTKNEKSR
ncbi:MAG: CinA family protein [Bacteroidales bacterium]|nr:CinA family protein [Candidatus Liminaster caballi]